MSEWHAHTSRWSRPLMLNRLQNPSCRIFGMNFQDKNDGDKSALENCWGVEPGKWSRTLSKDGVHRTKMPHRAELIFRSKKSSSTASLQLPTTVLEKGASY